jgi:hypothetical protein
LKFAALDEGAVGSHREIGGFFVEKNMDSWISLHKTEPVPWVLTVVDGCPLVV